MTSLAAVGALVLSGCSLLGLSDDTVTGPTVTTSAAGVADGTGTTSGAVTLRTRPTGANTPRSTPTPWASLTTAPATTTSSRPELTAPTTTRSLTFTSFAEATQPTVAAPTSVRSAPPECYTAGTCRVIDSDTTPAGTVQIVTPPGGADTVAVLVSGGEPVGAVSIAQIASASVSCVGNYCLVQGTHTGLHFGAVVGTSGGELRSVPGSATSLGPLHVAADGNSIMVAGTQQFNDYGLIGSDAPVGARTWTVSGGSLKSTGCAAPSLYTTPPTVSSLQSGPCSGTPRLAGYGAASGHKIVDLNAGFVTPSGNIECAITGGKTLVCSAKQVSFTVPKCSDTSIPEPLRLLRVRLGTSGAATHDGCLGFDLSFPKSTISYHRLAAGSGFVCVVTEAGIDCTAPSGRGFNLARAGLTTR